MELLGHEIGGGRPFFVIAGPCVIESEALALATARRLAEIAENLGLLLIYKSSFDKANRTSGTSFRGPGMAEGLRILGKVRAETGLPVLTDVHETAQVAAVAAVVDVLQVPAFLARQTDLVEAAAASGRPVLFKKAQYMAPADMVPLVAKARAAGGETLLLGERGTSFGYNNLVSDMRSLEIMAETGCPVVFDATHSVQAPGAGGTVSGGDRRFVPALARAAVAVGIAGLFVETHPDPAAALSDAATVWPLADLEPLLARLLAIDAVVKGRA
ncbi:2-dehydro-3-deoxyphosphooctonate aldolase [alpha proteobacterium AAP81b]|nr:2-dehydro-3-deoxyphosphooctonate aldolase [alpha proteobacterium AAP81b]